MSDRYTRMFEALRARSEGAFVPFCVLGDPDPETSLRVMLAMADAGADALELGIPFSDPVADGPTIQRADQRALAAGGGPHQAWALLQALRAARPEIPVGLLVYANLVERPGAAAFYRRAARAGVDSVLVADAPTLEVGPYAEAALACGVSPVCIAAPGDGEAHLREVARRTRGYTYVVSRGGVTGAEKAAGTDHGALMAHLARLGAPPCLLGFGISSPADVRAALAQGAAGAISGSAVVAMMERHLGDPAAMAGAASGFVAAMKEATLNGDRSETEVAACAPSPCTP